MNLYDLLAEPIADHSAERTAAVAAEVASTGRPSGPPRPSRPGSVYTAQIETTDERMINLRHTIAGP